MINAFHRDIWRFNFVHTWERPTTVPVDDFIEESEIFSQSFIEPPKEMTPSTPAVPNTYKQLSLFDDFFGSDREHSKSKHMKADNKKKKKKKKAKKQRKKIEENNSSKAWRTVLVTVRHALHLMVM
ncbi:hypothetical protein BTR23_24630 [Alkalihalophilus pseudofirmus]|nr:hypothetical protein BTR23_24630 [Alkalihalophilus pseudofirmus]